MWGNKPPSSSRHRDPVSLTGKPSSFPKFFFQSLIVFQVCRHPESKWLIIFSIPIGDNTCLTHQEKQENRPSERTLRHAVLLTSLFRVPFSVFAVACFAPTERRGLTGRPFGMGAHHELGCSLNGKSKRSERRQAQRRCFSELVRPRHRILKSDGCIGKPICLFEAACDKGAFKVVLKSGCYKERFVLRIVETIF